ISAIAGISWTKINISGANYNYDDSGGGESHIAGLVPQPANEDADKFLNAANEWALVNSAGIQDGTITSTDISDGTITNADIQNETIGAADIGVGAVGTSELADGSIQSIDIQNETITAADIGVGAVGTSELADASIQSIDIQDGTVVNSDISAIAGISWTKINISGANYNYDDSGGGESHIAGLVPQPGNGDADKFLNAANEWALVNSAGIQDGTITSTDISDGTITNADILSGTIKSFNIYDGTITNADIQDGTIINNDISNSAAIAWSKLNISKSNITGLGISATNHTHNYISNPEGGGDSNMFLNQQGNWTTPAGNYIGRSTNTWHSSSNDSKPRFYFGNNHTTYFRSGHNGDNLFEFRNRDDTAKVRIDGAGDIWTSNYGWLDQYFSESGHGHSGYSTSGHSHGSTSHTHNETDLNGIPESGGNSSLFLNQQGNWAAPSAPSHGHSYMRDVYHISQSGNYWSNINASTINNYCKDNDGCIVKITYKNGATIDIETFSLDYSGNHWKASNGRGGTDNNNTINPIHNTIATRCFLQDSDVYAGWEWEECMDITNGDWEFCDWEFMSWNDTGIGWTLRRSAASGTCHLSIRD
ncbi:MAG: hypothetical protein CL503_00175, partial [Actinobacteria bacterium]|nr:hypothetical protein [Actinomycetota bacterium]